MTSFIKSTYTKLYVYFTVFFLLPQVITCSTGQSLPPTISSSRKKRSRTTVQGRFILYMLWCSSAFRSKKKHQLDEGFCCIALAVVRLACYCGESDNVLLCETYSAYQRFFAVLTVAQWHRLLLSLSLFFLYLQQTPNQFFVTIFSSFDPSFPEAWHLLAINNSWLFRFETRKFQILVVLVSGFERQNEAL